MLAPVEPTLTILADLADQLAVATDLMSAGTAIADAVVAAFQPAACVLEMAAGDRSDAPACIQRGLSPPLADLWVRTGQQRLGQPDAPLAMQLLWPDLPAGSPAALLRLPLRVSGQPVIGTLTLFAHRAEHLPDPTAPIVRVLVSQAAAALVALARHQRETDAIHSMAHCMTGRIHLAPLAEAILHAAATLFGTSEGAIVLTETQASRHGGYQVAAQQGTHLPSATVMALIDACARHPLPCILQSLSPVVLANSGQALVAPLHLDRKLLGFMLLLSPAQAAFHAHDLPLLATIATHVTMALRNAQLYLWSEELVIAEERSRIAREIHDGLAQSLAHKLMKIDLCQRLIERDPVLLRQELDGLKQSIRADLQDVRHSILTLRPLDLEQRGLSEAIQAYVAQFSHDTGIKVTADIGSLERLSPKTQTALFRLMQEALNNIRKHARAATASVVIATDQAGQVVLRVADDGRGFDVGMALTKPPGQSGLGLRGMVERTRSANGTITITSQPGHGTQIEVHLPRAG